jgi:hypothetical protein
MKKVQSFSSQIYTSKLSFKRFDDGAPNYRLTEMLAEAMLSTCRYGSGWFASRHLHQGR